MEPRSPPPDGQADRNLPQFSDRKGRERGGKGEASWGEKKAPGSEQKVTGNFGHKDRNQMTRA